MTATTEVTYRRQPVAARGGRPKTGRTQIGSVDVIATSAAVLRPVVVAGAIIAAALMWGPRAQADVVHDALNDVGIGNNGPVSNMIAEVGTSICPLLVQPGSQMASTATQMSGNGGIAVSQRGDDRVGPRGAQPADQLVAGGWVVLDDRDAGGSLRHAPIVRWRACAAPRKKSSDRRR